MLDKSEACWRLAMSSPQKNGPKDGFDYGEGGYTEGGHNIGVNKATGQIHMEINGLTTPQSPEATRICKEDLNEVVTSFLQDKTVLVRFHCGITKGAID